MSSLPEGNVGMTGTALGAFGPDQLAAFAPLYGDLQAQLAAGAVRPGAAGIGASMGGARGQRAPKKKDDDDAIYTTVMLRNIPNKYTQNTLLQEIDAFGFFGSYDFFYLPMDVHNSSNVGYAFINFLSPTDAERFRKVFGSHRFQKFQSRKISSVCSAHVQGLDENLKHFDKRAVTHARNEQYRPIVLRGNQRVDFEEAIAEVKAHTSGSLAASRQEPLAAYPEVRNCALVVPPGLMEVRSCTDTTSLGLAEADLGERSGFNRRITPPTPPPPGLEPVLEDGMMHSRMHTGRQGLEAAIAEYLMSAQQKVTSGSVDPVPLAAGNLSGVVPGCLDAPPMHVGAGPPRAACPNEMPGASGMQSSEVNQLLSLRSMLVHSLRKQDVHRWQGMSGPAYVKLPPSSGLLGETCDLPNESGRITPRTSAVMLSGALGQMLMEDPRFLL
mmetsp:Transcript_24798/g.62158  ORF Transcript_24798/g.62158 Transcript_24798/m.62158 type:complete len:442 (-) Transcript_24798:325-1650(-)